MNELSGVLRNTWVLALARLLERTNTFILAFLISRMLGPAGLGIYSAALAYHGMISIAAELGTGNFLVREIARNPNLAGRYTTHVVYMTGCISIIMIAIAAPAIPLLGYGTDLQHAIALIILATLPATMNSIQEAVFVAYQRVHFQTYTTLATILAYSSLSIYLLTHNYGVISLIISFVVVKYLMTVVAYLFARRLIRFEWRIDFSFARRLIGELKSFSLSYLLAAMCARPELIILSLVETEAVVGYYSAAIKLVDFWYLLPQTFMANVFPLLSRSYAAANDSRSSTLQDRSIQCLAALSLPIAVGITFAAPRILEFVYGPEFVVAAPVLRCLAWTLPLACLNAVLWRILAARNRQDTVFHVQALSTAVRIASGYGLTLIVGAVGAALSAVLSLVAHNAMLLNRVRCNGTRLHPYRVGWRFAPAAALMGLVIFSIVDRIDFWIVALISAGIYIGSSILMRAFSPADLALVRQLVLPGKDSSKS
jgi:O-antigen/teichoic acid export membrane protein